MEKGEPIMTTEEKVAKFDELQQWLWDAARCGSPMQSMLASSLIRQFHIPSPEGDDPEDA